MNIQEIKEIKNNKLNKVYEMLKAIDMFKYAEDDYLDYGGYVQKELQKLEEKFANEIRYTLQDADYIEWAIALFLKETAYWFISELKELAEDYSTCLLEACNLCQEYCFYRTDKDEIIRFEDIKALREHIFQLYKNERNVNECDNERRLKLLLILTELICYNDIFNGDEDIWE